jgi:two-component sensor histidine kinase
MFNSQWLLCICMLLLPGLTAAQSDKSPKQLQKLLLETGQDTLRIKRLLELGKTYLYRRGELAVDLDSALTYGLEAKTLSEALKLKEWIFESVVLVSYCYIEKKDFQQCRSVFTKLVQEYQKTGDKELEANLWLKIAHKLRPEENMSDECIGYLYKAMALYQQMRMEKKAIDALKEIADAHFVQGKLNESEQELKEVLERYKLIGFPNLHYTYDLLSAVATKKGNLNQALYYGLETIKNMELTGDSASAVVFYYRVARIYSEIGQNLKSIEWYKKACDKRQGPSYISCLAVARSLILVGKPQEALAFVKNLISESSPSTSYERAYVEATLGECYNALHQYSMAEKHYLELAKEKEILNQQSDFAARLNFSLAAFYMDRHRHSEAKYYLNKILSLENGKVSLPRIKSAHYNLFKIDSSAGNFISAIRHYQIFKQLNDSVFNDTKSRQIEELQIQYETEKKDKDIALLQNETALQQSRLHEANLAKNITFGGGSLLLVILGLLYNSYRLKQRSNRQLELQQIEINKTNHSLQNLLNEKELLLREIHHRVKNNLQIVMSLLNTQSAYLQNDAAVTAIRDSQQRIHSISLIHKKLYQSNNIARINMPVYIQELVDYLQDSFGTGQSIRFDLDLAPIDLDVVQAVPIGLILNEAISNSVKYAFPDQRSGLISISMEHGEADQFKLIIADNGIGLPPGFDLQQSASLGMSLMRGLSKQLHGSFDLRNERGLRISVIFANDNNFQSSTQSPAIETME